MKKFAIKVSIIFLMLCAVGTTHAEITVACAANVQYAMEEIKSQAIKAGIPIKVIYGSSGKLAGQIKFGAPFDVFVSADIYFPESLYIAKYAISKPQIYAYGKLVVWTTKNITLNPKLNFLNDPKLSRIAIPDPKRAPYGQEALKALKKAGKYDVVLKHLVYGESISQTAQYIETGSVDVGFNAKSIVVAGPMKQVGKWVEVDSTLYDPIAQAVVLLQYGKDNHPDISKRFYQFLFSKEAQQIFEKYGYVLP